MTLDKVFLALHVTGSFMWIGGIFTTMAFLSAVHEAEPGAGRTRLVKHLREAALVADVGATLAIVFGLHWLFKYKLYAAHYMHAKLAIVAGLLALQVIQRIKVKAARKDLPFSPIPTPIKGVVMLGLLGILIFVLGKPF